MRERDKVLLGGLLHDIGKFRQRGQKEESRRHEKYSGDFFDQYIPEKWGDAAYIAELHHEKEGETDELIEAVRLADHLSAKEREEGKGQPKNTRLSPVQNRVYVPSKEEESISKESDKKLALQALDLGEKSILPGDLPEEELTDRYSQLWDGFTEEVQSLPAESFESFFTGLYYLLYKYGSNVPSATWRSRPDISLFDHARTTAAFATCLYETDMREELVYLEGDISGVQDFIYRISSPQVSGVKKQMANRLRGRSFYLTLLNRSFAQYFLDELYLPLTNLLWSGGGHFSLILPGTAPTSKKVDEVGRRINEYLFKEFKGRLYLAVGKSSVSGEKLGRDFSSVKADMANELAREKRKKFSEMDVNRKFGLSDKVCPICDNSYSGEAETCPDCRTHVEVGKKLRNAEVISRLPKEAKEEADLSLDELNQFWKMGTSKNSLIEYGINDPEFVRSGHDGFFLIANRVPDRPVFTEMAELGTGADYLGVLRMDVDDLGAVFALGIPEEDRSISRFATLSRHLDVFFTGYLDQLCADYPSTYTTYSGGDDVFIVGEWSEMIELALEVRNDFERFGCGRSDFHISASLFVTEPTYPIGRAAQRAGENLEAKAKSREGKNAVHLFGQTVPWNDFPKLLGFAKRLVTLLEEDEISKSLLRTINGLYNRHIDEESEELVWIPKLLYSLTRNVENEGLREELKRKFQKHSEHLSVVISYVTLATRETKQEA